MTALYAVMHFFVDYICAWAMFRYFQDGSGGYADLLIYNFCAFALQMPLGTLLDLMRKGTKARIPCLWAVSGAALTVVGALLHPAVLGLGNALFHVGGGMDVIGADFEKHRKGRDLGVFVAPGAIGLYLGTCLGKSGDGVLPLLIGTAALILLAVFLPRCVHEAERAVAVQISAPGNILPLALSCFAVVILRSYIGLSVSFPWKTGALYGWLAVAAVAMGKMTGGFLSARFGPGRTMTVSLVLAAVCFLFGQIPIWGLGALFLFNMSMPVTLYLLARHLPRIPGFSFGLLTFGLFLGFLPVYAGLELPLAGSVLGAAGSILSAVLLTIGGKAVRRGKVSA